MSRMVGRGPRYEKRYQSSFKMLPIPKKEPSDESMTSRVSLNSRFPERTLADNIRFLC